MSPWQMEREEGAFCDLSGKEVNWTQKAFGRCDSWEIYGKKKFQGLSGPNADG